MKILAFIYSIILISAIESCSWLRTDRIDIICVFKTDESLSRFKDISFIDNGIEVGKVDKIHQTKKGNLVEFYGTMHLNAINCYNKDSNYNMYMLSKEKCVITKYDITDKGHCLSAGDTIIIGVYSENSKRILSDSLIRIL